jgi:A/G-specific adenine glycosylase
MSIPSSEKKQFQQLVLERYSANKRDLPWRKTTDPYKIMMSEFMLQQTQVPRVIQKFTRWIELWPTVGDLANAPRVDVLREWSGLGFNRRAINLHEAVKQISSAITNYELQITNKVKSKKLWTMNYQLSTKKSIDFFMSDYAYLRSLPWVGEYTANAVLAFAYNQEVPVMDINIKRVLIHTFQLSHDTTLFELQELALSLVPQWQSRDWHNALMDYWSQVLNSKATWIQSAKQSIFKWSDREVRWWIMKQLAIKPKVSIATIQKQRPVKDVGVIIQKLQKDWLIIIQWSHVTVSS